MFSYFAAKECTYTDSSGRPVPAPLASKTDKPARAGPSRRRPQKDLYQESPVSPSTSIPSATRGEPLTSPQPPSDTRDDYAERSKRPRLASASFPATESQAPAPLAPRSAFATSRFEVPVVRELVNRTYVIIPPLYANLFGLSLLCSLSSPSSLYSPTHLHGRCQPGTHTPLSIICAMRSRCPLFQATRCTDGFSPQRRRSILQGSRRTDV